MDPSAATSPTITRPRPGALPAMRRRRGFTLIELLVVLAIIAALLTLVAPRYFDQTDQAQETVLRYNLSAMREAIDRFHSHQGRYPAHLQELVDKRYLREIPLDTVSNRRDSWRTLPPPSGEGGVYDVRSGATGEAKDGTRYADW